MPSKSEEAEAEIEEEGKLQFLRKRWHKVKRFLNQRYVWSSLTFGFLWMLSAPLIITMFQRFLNDFTITFPWVLRAVFLPLTLSGFMFGNAIEPLWILMYCLSFVISILFCLSVAYMIHRVRIIKKRKQIVK